MDPAMTHVKFSQLVRDETLLKPRLDDRTLQGHVEAVQVAYRDAIVSLHETVSDALQHPKEPTQDGELAGLYGRRSEDVFDVDALAAELSGEPVAIESDPKSYPDLLIRTVDDDDLPDAHFLAFMRSKTFYGKAGSTGYEEGDLRAADLHEEMKRVKEEIRKANEAGNEALAQKLQRTFEALEMELRFGEPSAVGSHTGKKNAEMAQDPPAASYAERHSES
jgi:hypothetical protein